jgi:hypothetical protein
MSQPSFIAVRKHTFLSSAAMGFSAVIITVLISLTVVLLYTVHVASEKSERVITLAQSAIRGLPEAAKSLPPALSDMLDDQRRPDYTKSLAISAKVTPLPGPHGRMRTAVEVVNNGDEVVSLLALRVIILDEREERICEAQEWAATPFAAEGGWRGPIMPGSRRYFVSTRGCWSDVDRLDALNAEVEVTELRVWNGPKEGSPSGTEPTGQPTASVAIAASPGGEG